MTYDSGASQLAPWLNPTVIRKPSSKEGYKSSSESNSDPFSRLTYVADAEIQQIEPAYEKDLLAIEDGHQSQKLPEIQDSRSRSVSRQSKSRPSSRMLSGMKSRASTKLPRIYTSVHIDEEEEELMKHTSDSEGDSEEDITLAPWLTPAGAKKNRRSARSRSRSSSSQMSSKSKTDEAGGDINGSRLGRSRAEVDEKSRSRSAVEESEIDQLTSSETLTVEKNDSGKVKSRSGSNLKSGHDQSVSEPKADFVDEIKSDKTEKPVKERTRSQIKISAETPHDPVKNGDEPVSDRPKSRKMSKEEEPYHESQGDRYSESEERFKSPRQLQQKEKSRTHKEQTRSRSPERVQQKEKSRAYKERSRSPKEKSRSVREKSKSFKRTKTSFERSRSPEVRPASFRSERHEEDQKDSGIEQSEVSDAPGENRIDRERTKTILPRSARSRSSSAVRAQQKSARSVADQGFETLDHQVDKDISQPKSRSRPVKSLTDEDKIESLDDGRPSENRVKSASRKASIQRNDISSRQSSDSVPLDFASPLDGENDDLEEELMLPGLSVIGGESVTDDVKTSRASHKKSRRESDTGIEI